VEPSFNNISILLLWPFYFAHLVSYSDKLVNMANTVTRPYFDALLNNRALPLQRNQILYQGQEKHRSDCPELLNFGQMKIIEVKWPSGQVKIASVVLGV